MTARTWALPAFALCLVAIGCDPQGAKSPADIERDVARSAVLLFVEGATVADTLCANIAVQAKGTKDEAKLSAAYDLANKCSHGYDVAIEGAQAANDALKVWEDGGSKRFGCAAVHALDGFNAVADAVKAAGGTLPPVLVDAVKRAEAFRPFVAGALCYVPKKAGAK